eukprot:gene6746-4839_t
MGGSTGDNEQSQLLNINGPPAAREESGHPPHDTTTPHNHICTTKRNNNNNAKRNKQTSSNFAIKSSVDWIPKGHNEDFISFQLANVLGKEREKKMRQISSAVVLWYCDARKNGGYISAMRDNTADTYVSFFPSFVVGETSHITPSPLIPNHHGEKNNNNRKNNNKTVLETTATERPAWSRLHRVEERQDSFLGHWGVCESCAERVRRGTLPGPAPSPPLLAAWCPTHITPLLHVSCIERRRWVKMYVKEKQTNKQQQQQQKKTTTTKTAFKYTRDKQCCFACIATSALEQPVQGDKQRQRRDCVPLTTSI